MRKMTLTQKLSLGAELTFKLTILFFMLPLIVVDSLIKWAKGRQ